MRWNDVEPLAHILTDPMQAIAAARAGMVFDVDDHLDARQMRRQRTPVRPPLCGAFPACGRIGTFGRLLAGGLDLLGLLKAKEELTLRQAFGPAAEAVALQFLDDLDQPRILDVARQDHCLQRIRIVGKLVRRHRHEQITPYSPAPGDSGIQADSLGRGSTRLRRSARPAGFMDPKLRRPFIQGVPRTFVPIGLGTSVLLERLVIRDKINSERRFLARLAGAVWRWGTAPAFALRLGLLAL